MPMSWTTGAWHDSYEIPYYNRKRPDAPVREPITRTCVGCGAIFRPSARIGRTLLCETCMLAHDLAAPDLYLDMPGFRQCHECGGAFQPSDEAPRRRVCPTCIRVKARREDAPTSPRRPKSRRKPVKRKATKPKPKAPPKDKRPTAWDKILNPVLKA